MNTQTSRIDSIELVNSSDQSQNLIEEFHSKIQICIIHTNIRIVHVPFSITLPLTDCEGGGVGLKIPRQNLVESIKETYNNTLPLPFVCLSYCTVFISILYCSLFTSCAPATPLIALKIRVGYFRTCIVVALTA